jgi:hypothetical protein
VEKKRLNSIRLYPSGATVAVEFFKKEKEKYQSISLPDKKGSSGFVHDMAGIEKKKRNDAAAG